MDRRAQAYPAIFQPGFLDIGLPVMRHEDINGELPGGIHDRGQHVPIRQGTRIQPVEQLESEHLSRRQKVVRTLHAALPSAMNRSR